VTEALQAARDALAAFKAPKSTPEEGRAGWTRDDFELHRQVLRDHNIMHASKLALALERLIESTSHRALTADEALIRLEDAISNIDYPGSDSVEWEHKAMIAAKALRELVSS